MSSGPPVRARTSRKCADSGRVSPSSRSSEEKLPPAATGSRGRCVKRRSGDLLLVVVSGLGCHMIARALVALGLLLAAPQCGGQESSCRLFASQFSYSGTVGSNIPTNASATCSFNRPRLTVDCIIAGTTGSSNFSTSTAVTWSSIDDAVAANRPLGRVTFSRSATVAGNCTYNFTAGYDGQHRLTGVVATASDDTRCGTFNQTWTAWDSSGRHTQGTNTGVGTASACTGQNVVRSFDDANRTVTTTNSGGSTACGTSTSVATYDANYQLLSSVTTTSSSTDTLTYTTAATSTICK